MTPPQGAFYWSGVQALLHGSYTLSLGVNPGVATLAIPPQPNGIAMQGTLLIRFGPVTIKMPDCRVAKVDAHFESSGRKYWLLHILDGRWKWRFGIAREWANRRLSNGFLDLENRKKPKDIAKALATACGIANLDVSVLPDDTFPFIDWEWRERPDLLLAQFCEMHGCRIAYGPNGVSKIVRAGIGAPIPKDQALEYQVMLDPAELPSEIIFAAGRSVWNVDVPVEEAVGEEPDGKIKPIDDLSYKPAGGWGVADVPRFACIGIMNTKVMECAQRSVFRWYRPKLPFWIDGTRKVEKLWQILPWNNYQVVPTDNFGFCEQYSKDNFVMQAPWAWGEYIKPHETFRPVQIAPGGNIVTVAKDIIVGGFNIDVERGIVQFAQPMFRFDANGFRQPAKMKVRVATSFRDLKTKTFEHWTAKYPLTNKPETKPRYLVHEEIAFRKGPDIASGQLNGPMFDNTKDLEKLAKYYYDQAAFEYQFQAPEVAVLPGFYPIATDGAIQQVRWSVEEGRPTTFVARNTEIQPPGGSWSDHRFYQDAIAEITDGHRNHSRQRF